MSNKKAADLWQQYQQASDPDECGWLYVQYLAAVRQPEPPVEAEAA